MTLHILTTYSSPQYDAHLRRIREARSAAFWAAIGPLRRVIGQIADGVSAAARFITEQRQRVATLRSLERMSTRELEDIGLSRADLLAFEAGEEIRRPSDPAAHSAVEPVRPAPAQRAGRPPQQRPLRARGRFRKAAA